VSLVVGGDRLHRQISSLVYTVEFGGAWRCRFGPPSRSLHVLDIVESWTLYCLLTACALSTESYEDISDLAGLGLGLLHRGYVGMNSPMVVYKLQTPAACHGQSTHPLCLKVHRRDPRSDKENAECDARLAGARPRRECTPNLVPAAQEVLDTFGLVQRKAQAFGRDETYFDSKHFARKFATSSPVPIRREG